MLQTRIASAASVTMRTQMKLLSSAAPSAPAVSRWAPLTSKRAMSSAASRAKIGKVRNRNRRTRFFFFLAGVMPSSGPWFDLHRP